VRTQGHRLEHCRGTLATGEWQGLCGGGGGGGGGGASSASQDAVFLMVAFVLVFPFVLVNTDTGPRPRRRAINCWGCMSTGGRPARRTRAGTRWAASSSRAGSGTEAARYMRGRCNRVSGDVLSSRDMTGIRQQSGSGRAQTHGQIRCQLRLLRTGRTCPEARHGKQQQRYKLLLHIT